MASPIFMSKPPPGFSVVAILRGFQLAFLGAYRSLQNPSLFNSAYFRQALIALAASIIVQLAMWVPILAIRVLIRILDLVFTLKNADHLVKGLQHFQFNVLNIGVFVLSASRFFSRQLDDVFLSSLQFVDSVALIKHPDRKDQYHANLLALSKERPKAVRPSWRSIREKYASTQDFAAFVQRHLWKTAASIGIYFLSKVPIIGSIVLGAISFQNLNDKIGTFRAGIVFVLCQVAPKYYSVLFLTTFWGSRNMVHDLLLPYFSRVRYTELEKEQWMKSRAGLLFGFGLCYFLLIQRFPWVGLLIYGFAESSVAYLITKVSDSPPSLANLLSQWVPSQMVWNKEREYEILSGQFIKSDDGFTPIPGSFIFTHNDK